jgi:hypothetical protein
MSEKIDPKSHLENRQWMVAALAGEIFGPGGRFAGWKNDLYKRAEEIDPVEGFVFSSWDEYNRKRHVQSETDQEILKDEPPSKRYGVGLLFPEEAGISDRREESVADSDAALEAASGVMEKAVKSGEESKQERKMAVGLADRCNRLSGVANRDDEIINDVLPGDEDEPDALQLSRIRRPRSMGITFAVAASTAFLKIVVEGARYRQIKVKVQGKEGSEPTDHTLWVRAPVSVEWMVDVAGTKPVGRHPLTVGVGEIPGLPPLKLTLDIRIRSMPSQSTDPTAAAHLVTVTLVNRSVAGRGDVEKLTFFQSRFRVEIEDANTDAFLPLPRFAKAEQEEEASLALLYRGVQTFATGHGCTGDWDAKEGVGSAVRVIAEPLPVHETPAVTPDLIYPEWHAKAGQELKICMLPLARGDAGCIAPLQELADLYEGWIARNEREIPSLGKELWKAAAGRHMEAARRCLARIRKGLALLTDEADAAKAFRLANEAVLLQQIAGRQGVRSLRFDSKEKRWLWDREIKIPSLSHGDAPDCTWRPFQIAFLLMSLPGLWDGSDSDRQIADLIWFPTGGGKTEAYLGTTAFYLLARRLQDPEDDGTGVLMRYTLRLLTSQQFQRAAGLICSLEQIRKREGEDLGNKPFGIGIWVGGGTTPNTRKLSLEAFHNAEDEGPDAYQHVMLRCPWCGAQMGPLRNPSRHGKKFICSGLAASGSGKSRTVRIFCPDDRCDFHGELPVSAVDEEIYDIPPSVVIGTVDKFAMLAWKPEARAIFGIDENGKHRVSPPGLIIQDELHLITGPLGSMVGLYEAVIEELCTDRRGPNPVKPKLVASTATTRASTRQIHDLYARNHTAIFPPPGLEASDSFFATYDRDENGNLVPGRMYLGVLARAYGSGLTVNVRVFAALLAAAQLIAEDERDSWFTLLVFHNSLRELGAGLTLFGADVPERLADLRNRWNPGEKRRYLNEVLELTGRLENSEVPRALEALERKFPEKKAVDACLASNIIEVGVDVPRLGLMAVSGQPKNTAQYIQATGRVGRVFPGLVLMVYDNRKARDLSHYEQFRDYHGRLYAAVEPASVTPFTIRVVERALHGAFVAWIRNRLPLEAQRDPRRFIPEGSAMRSSLKDFYECFRHRIDFLFKSDPASLANSQNIFKEMMNRRADEWSAWTRVGAGPCAVQWSNNDMTGDSGDQPLLRQYGQACKKAWEPYTWPTPTSMRGVDAECTAEVVHQIIETGYSTQSQAGMFD